MEGERWAEEAWKEEERQRSEEERQVEEEVEDWESKLKRLAEEARQEHLAEGSKTTEKGKGKASVIGDEDNNSEEEYEACWNCTSRGLECVRPK